MSELQTISRVTIIADAAMEKPLIERCEGLGARGYTVSEARGKGQHETVENIFATTGTANRVRIELLVTPEVGKKILDYLHGDHFKRIPMLACMENVQIIAGEHF